MKRDCGPDPFDYPCGSFARLFRAYYYGGAFLTAVRGVPWEDLA